MYKSKVSIYYNIPQKIEWELNDIGFNLDYEMNITYDLDSCNRKIKSKEDQELEIKKMIPFSWWIDYKTLHYYDKNGELHSVSHTSISEREPEICGEATIDTIISEEKCRFCDVIIEHPDGIVKSEFPSNKMIQTHLHTHKEDQVICYCGNTYLRGDIQHHFKSEIHQNYKRDTLWKASTNSDIRDTVYRTYIDMCTCGDIISPTTGKYCKNENHKKLKIDSNWCSSIRYK